MHKTNLQQQILVNAPPSKVWKVLTRPNYVNQYFSKDRVQCDWMEGSPIFIISENGKTPINAGQVLESVPGMFLKFRLLEEKIFVTTTYELIIASGGVELKIKSEGFVASHPEYLIRVQHANVALQKIKWLSEYS